jgi:hypothetical protein
MLFDSAITIRATFVVPGDPVHDEPKVSQSVYDHVDPIAPSLGTAGMDNLC